jgi:hypothetical protein
LAVVEPGATVYSYYGLVPEPVANREIFYGSQSFYTYDGGALTETDTLTISGGALVHEYPEALGQHWSTATATTEVGTITGQESGKSTHVTFLDGTYTTEATYVAGSEKEVSTTSVSANGKAKITDSLTNTNVKVTEVGSPVASHGKFVLPFSVSGGNALPNAPTPAQTVDVPDWFPSHDLPPNPLYSGETVNKGLVTTPAVCGKRAGLKAYLLYTTVAVLDPLLGTDKTTVTSEYDAPSLGDVCSTEDILTDEYANGSSGIPQATGKLTATVKENIVSILTAETGPKPLLGFGGGVPVFTVR